MDKDLKGCIKYISLILLGLLMPIITLGLGYLVLLGVFGNNGIFFLLGLVCFPLIPVSLILYILIPIFSTVKAMNNNWSKYLNYFFYSSYIPTLLFVAIAFLLWFFYNDQIDDHNKIRINNIASVIIPYYTFVYATIIINNIIKFIKSKQVK